MTFTKSQLIALNTNGKSGNLSATITANGDDNAIFFVVDLEKIRVTTYNYGKNITQDDVYVVWSCKVLQNNKALLSTTLRDGMYYELTYNGDKKQLYLDAYKKFENRCIEVD